MSTPPDLFYLALKSADWLTMKVRYYFALCLIAAVAALQVEAQAPEPIIDMHLHAMHRDELGPPPIFLCAPFLEWPLLLACSSDYQHDFFGAV